MRSILKFCFAILCLCSAQVTVVTYAQPPVPSVTPSVHRWLIDDGLPLNHVNQVLQTSNGFVWVATDEGLARYDGRHFYILTHGNVPAFRDNQIMHLRQDASGTLWVLTRTGLVSCVAGTFRDQTPSGLISDIDDVWIGSDGHLRAISKERLMREDGGKLHVLANISEALSGSQVVSIPAETPDGTVWFGTNDGRMVRVKDGLSSVVLASRDIGQAPVFVFVSGNQIYAAGLNGLEIFDPSSEKASLVYRNPSHREWKSAGSDSSGAIWLQNDSILVRCWHGQYKTFNIAEIAGIGSVLASNTGELYANSASGLLRFTGRIFARVGQSVHDSPLAVTSVFQSSAGALWIGTEHDGLLQITQSRSHVWDRSSGLPSSKILATLRDSQGTVWVSTSAGGVERSTASGFERAFVEHGHSSSKPSVANLLDRMMVTSMAEGPDGRMYFTDGNRLICLYHGQLADISPRGGIGGRPGGVSVDASGDVWLLGESKILRLSGASVHAYLVGVDVPEEAGQPHFVRSVRSGTTLVGFQRGLAVIGKSGLKYFSKEQGYGSVSINDATEDASGDIWLATSGTGLLRVHNGHVGSVGLDQGLCSDTIYSVAIGPAGSLMLGSDKGIYTVSVKSLDIAIDNSSSQAECVRMDASFGLSGSPCSPGPQPRSFADHDGTVWVISDAGLEEIAPPGEQANFVVPIIDSARAEGIDLLDPHHRGLEYGVGTAVFHFTVISRENSSEPHVRYRLLGWDKDWIDADQLTEARYAGLQPGKYQFQVETWADGDMAHAQVTSLPFTVAESLADGRLLRFTAAAAAIVCFLLVCHWRVRVLKLANAASDRVVKARTEELLGVNDELLGIQSALGEKTLALAAIRDELELQNSELQSAQAVLGTRDEELDFYRRLVAETRFSLDAANRQLEHLEVNDKLTNLRNHRAFQEKLEDECDRIRRYPFPMGLVMMDLDNFSQYNEKYGCEEGDEILRQLSGILTLSARDTDFVARYDGEQFFVVLPHTDCAGAAAAAERFRTAMECHEWPHEPVTASFGVCEMSRAYSTPAKLIDATSAAVRYAKAHGKNQVIVAPLGIGRSPGGELAA